jgi:hypothetical protein
MQTCFGKCYGCKWDCENLYQNKRNKEITDEFREQQKVRDKIMKFRCDKLLEEIKKERNDKTKSNL